MISHLPCDKGIEEMKARNDPMEIKAIASVAEKRLSFQLLTPKVRLHFRLAEQHGISTSNNCSGLMFQRTLSRCNISLPIYLPVGETAAEVQLYSNSWLDKFSYILSKSTTGKN